VFDEGRRDLLKVLLFGTGRFYQNRKKAIAESLQGEEVIGFVDNRASEIGTFEGKPVYLPEKIPWISFDRIVLMSASQNEMMEQLLWLGIPRKKIFSYEHHWKMYQQKNVALPIPSAAAPGKKSVLIITHEMRYDGATIVVTYAARALMALGHVVTIAAPYVQPMLEKEVRKVGIDLVRCPGLPYLGEREIAWIKQYDILLVNVFPNIRVACSMRKILPVLWWIHEAGNEFSDVYPETRKKFREYDSVSEMRGIHIMGVSRLAAEIFLKQYPGLSVGILPYGIPDERSDVSHRHGRIVFAVIGSIIPLKGQRELLKAFQMIWNADWAKKAEIWLIGGWDDSPYTREVQKLAEELVNVKLLGILTRKELQKAYREIDVVVCASRQETLSTVVAEGLMHGKVCVTMKNTGIASYLHSGVDAYVCENNQPEQLAEALLRVMRERDCWNEIRKRARALYETEFSMKAFGKRLEQEILVAEREYCELWEEK